MHRDAPILALDTSGPLLAAALWTPGGEPREVSLPLGRQHAERLPDVIAELLRGAVPGRVAVGLGPGSYTGLRVGAAYALGLARGWGVPVCGVSSLLAAARCREDQGPLALHFAAGRGRVYGAVYGPGLTERVPAQRLEAGEFAALAAEHGAAVHEAVPCAVGLAQLAFEGRGGAVEPLYL